MSGLFALQPQPSLNPSLNLTSGSDWQEYSVLLLLCSLEVDPRSALDTRREAGKVLSLGMHRESFRRKESKESQVNLHAQL